MRVLVQLPLLPQLHQCRHKHCHDACVERILVADPTDRHIQTHTHWDSSTSVTVSTRDTNNSEQLHGLCPYAPLADLVRFLDVVLIVVRLCLCDALHTTTTELQVNNQFSSRLSLCAPTVSRAHQIEVVLEPKLLLNVVELLVDCRRRVVLCGARPFRTIPNQSTTACEHP